MLGYKDTHKYVSAVNAENDSGIFPFRPFLLSHLHSKQARLVVDEKSRTAPMGDLKLTGPLER